MRKDLREFFLAKYEDNGAIGIGPFSCRFQRLVGPNGQLLHPPCGQSNKIPGSPKNSAFRASENEGNAMSPRRSVGRPISIPAAAERPVRSDIGGVRGNRTIAGSLN
jgi:hypothetical protein